MIGADAAWVAGSLILLALGGLPVAGSVTIGVVAAIVAALAIGQAAGLVGLRGDDPLAGDEVVQAVRVLAAPPAAVWPLISNHTLYSRLAPNLSTVEVISEPGAPLRRRCVNTAGRGWEETCTLWETGKAVRRRGRHCRLSLPARRDARPVAGRPAPGGQPDHHALRLPRHPSAPGRLVRHRAARIAPAVAAPYLGGLAPDRRDGDERRGRAKVQQ